MRMAACIPTFSLALNWESSVRERELTRFATLAYSTAEHKHSEELIES